MFPSKHLSKQYLFKTWPCPSWNGLWAFVGFGLLGLGLGLYLLQRLTRKTLNVKANDLVLHYKKPPLVDSHQDLQKKVHELDEPDDVSELDEQGCEERRFFLDKQNRLFSNKKRFCITKLVKCG